MRALIALTVAVLLSALAALPATALEPGEMLQNPAQEARARALTRTLRCMVCQNESIDESNAPLARDLRLLVRERIAAGESDAAVRDYLVARYGEFILLEPRVGPHTLLLWGLPAAVLLLGVGGVVLVMRRARAPAPPLSAAERQRLSALLEADSASRGTTKREAG